MNVICQFLVNCTVGGRDVLQLGFPAFKQELTQLVMVPTIASHASIFAEISLGKRLNTIWRNANKFERPTNDDKKANIQLIENSCSTKRYSLRA